ncbi:response regulator transcription factor [Desulfobacula sp.]|uniref:response regulator n=1 Tax=Desulfobacula sp. TaxID=2593537 RepID=UPI00261B0A85|nr:response regulator transcription factor [Desulfobacula sp.]
MLKTKKIKIIIVDDHTIVRHGISQSFSMEDNFEVIAEADSGRSAISLALLHRPDIVIMDVSMPDLNGIETTQKILANNSNIKVIALTMHAEKVYVMGMLNAGASGYLLKSSSFKELLKCIKMVLSGEMFFCQEVSRLIAGKNGRPVKDKRVSVFSLLSKKERQVLQLIAEGHKSKEIAEKLYISVRTVDVHRIHLKKKLNINNVAELTKFAISEGITSPNF